MKPIAKQRIRTHPARFRSRRVDEAVRAAHMEATPPVFHLGNGRQPSELLRSFRQEPCAAGVCAHLGADGAGGAARRPYHVAIARGVELKRMTAAPFGKNTGVSGGRAGPMLFGTIASA